jgi:bacterioferritin (cytochrome b1)
MQQYFCVRCKNLGYITGVDLVKSPCLCVQNASEDALASDDDEMQQVAELDAMMSSSMQPASEIVIRAININEPKNQEERDKIEQLKAVQEGWKYALNSEKESLEELRELDKSEEVINKSVKKRGRPKKVK